MSRELYPLVVARGLVLIADDIDDRSRWASLHLTKRIFVGA